MTATAFGPSSLATHRISRRNCPAVASNRPRHRRLGPLRASEGLDSGLLEIRQPLQVVAGRHHRHRKARPRLADGAQQLATHLLEDAEHVLNPGARFGDALVTPLLALGQRLVTLALPLDLIPEALLFEPGFTRLGRVAPVGIDVPTRVACIEDAAKVLAVVRTRRVGLDPANDLVFLVGVDRELVAEVALAVLLGPDGVDVLLPPLRRLPVGGHRTLLDQFLLASAVVLLGGGDQGGVDDLTAARDETLPEQLRRDTVKERLGTGFTDPVLEGPYRGAVRDVGRVRQSAEALVAHPVEQRVLHLLVGQVVQTLEHQDPHHGFGRVRRTPALRAHRARRNLIHLGRQRPKVDVRLDVGQRVAKRVELLAVVFVSEQVSLDGGAWFHRCRLRGSGRRNFTKGGRGGGFSGRPFRKVVSA
jgi:hypothetical protein